MFMQKDSRLAHSLVIAAVVGLTATVAGCGKSGAERYDVSGAVTYAGRPVPAGQILFQPDASKGNKGPATMVTIKDGRYDTAEGGKGTVGGPHIAVISGFSGQADAAPESRSAARPLFRDARLPVDLPKETSVQDLAVPAAR